MDTHEQQLEEAYCRKLMEQIRDWELDPRNFTKVMRAQNSMNNRRGVTRLSSLSYNSYANTSAS